MNDYTPGYSAYYTNSVTNSVTSAYTNSVKGILWTTGSQQTKDMVTDLCSPLLPWKLPTVPMTWHTQFCHSRAV